MPEKYLGFATNSWECLPLNSLCREAPSLLKLTAIEVSKMLGG